MTEGNSTGPVALDEQTCYAIYSAGMAIQRAYKPLLDDLGLTYPQYLVLNVLWREDGQTVGGIADRLALESSTLTPLLKRLEAAGIVSRQRNPDNERQVRVVLTEQGRSLRSRASCLGDRLVTVSGDSARLLAQINQDVRKLRDSIYAQLDGWALPS
jgi:DNA-binding MarR family transcriptional regulator